MILHLLKTDWQRLRGPIIGVWFILLLASLPWLLHNPDGFEIPMSATSSSGSGSLERLGFTIHSPLDRSFVQLMVVGSTLLLSTAIGMHDQRWQGTNPIRSWKRFAAKTLGLFLFIVVPQFLLGCGVMLVHGFNLPLILTAAAGIILTLLLFHGTAAMFGRCCASFWTWSAAAVCIGAITRITGTSLMLPNFWSEYPGPKIWLIGCVSLLGIALLPRLFRTRPGSIAAIATAIAAIVLPGFIPQKIPLTIWLERGGIDTSGIEASLSPEGLQLQSEESTANGRTSFRSRYTGQVLSSGAPPDTYLSWQAGEMTLDPSILLNSILNSASRHDALRAILPAPMSPNFSQTGSEVTFYELDSPNSPSSTVLTGVAFRYEKLCDLPLDETPAAQVRNHVGVNARLHHSLDLGPLVEITLRHPSLGISQHCDAITNSMSSYGPRAFTYVLYLPKRESCIELSPSLTQTSLLACLDPPFMAHYGGQVYQVVAALAELEDPETYPALLSAYEQTRHSHLYEIIRNLPGIGPELDQVIERISESLPSSPGFQPTNTSSAIDVLSTFSGPVSHGNPVAFAKLF